MKIYVWGTGRLVGKVVGEYIQVEDVAGFIDNDVNKKEFLGKPVYRPQEILSMEYDAILVSVLAGKAIYNQCNEIGIDLNKVVFLYDNCTIQDMNKDYGFVEKIVGKKYSSIIKNRYHLVRDTTAFGNLCFENAERAMGGGT